MRKKADYRAATHNPVIFDSFIKADNILNKRGYENIQVSISGGADSDIPCHSERRAFLLPAAK